MTTESFTAPYLSRTGPCGATPKCNCRGVAPGEKLPTHLRSIWPTCDACGHTQHVHARTDTPTPTPEAPTDAATPPEPEPTPAGDPAPEATDDDE